MASAIQLREGPDQSQVRQAAGTRERSRRIPSVAIGHLLEVPRGDDKKFRATPRQFRAKNDNSGNNAYLSESQALSWGSLTGGAHGYGRLGRREG
jgi:hypothetical protein